MRRIAIWIASTVTIVVLLFGYHTSTDGAATVSSGTGAGTGQQSSRSSSGSAGSPPERQPTGQGSSGTTGTKSSTSRKSAVKKKTVIGDVATTQWGPVQVKIVVINKKIVSVKVIQKPNGNPRDDQINSYAVPILISETVNAQDAKIDMVSGATVTSDGYLQSLQSALDKAGL